jgi:plastocyanin
VLAAPRAGAAAPELQGTVGPDFSIHLKQGGRLVKSLRAGTYLLTVTTLKVKLRPGRYSYVCDPHHTIMHGSFTVH